MRIIFKIFKLNNRENCLLLNVNEQNDCLSKQIYFHSYKVIKGIFNYGKTAIYAGLWASRYVRKIICIYLKFLDKKLFNFRKKQN
jgi:hypothetical protein